MNATERREVRRVAFNETMLPLERALNASLVPMGVEPTRAPTNPIEVPIAHVLLHSICLCFSR